MNDLQPTKACRTLEAKRANDIVPKKYHIGTKVGRIFLRGGGGGAWEMSNMYLKFGTILRCVPICKILSRIHNHERLWFSVVYGRTRSICMLFQ